MNSFAHKKTGDDLTHRYQINLERQIEKGDRSLVCRNEDLCKEVETLLRNCNAQKIHHVYGFDSLTVMERSLRVFHYKTGQMGLEKLSKAFEVLELAALNLYIYPWRREYRMVKMFSGGFTHLIKPVLTLQQAKELFGLLGYQPSSMNEEEELALSSKPIAADFLLNLACGFFAARMECQLLLSTLGFANKDVEWVLQLVKERQAGHNLQVALENTKRISDVASASDAVMSGGIDSDLDLYTEQANADHVMSTSHSPPRSSYTQSKDITLSKPLHKETSQSYMRNNENAVQVRSHYNSGPVESFDEDQSESDASRQAAAKAVCSCITPDVFYTYQCETCDGHHALICIRLKECRSKGHILSLSSFNPADLYSTQAQSSLAKEKSKDSMKNHYCMASPTSDSFLVCYDCQYIHDHNCNAIKICRMQHNVQPTGKIQPPQGEKENAQKKHKCPSSGAPLYVIGHTCNNTHDIICQDRQNCVRDAHHLQYPQETGDSEIRQVSIARSDNHIIHDVGTECITCHSSAEFDTFCRFCGALYCRRCCFRQTMTCKCGNILFCSSAV